ncbi:hypothetical protein [Erythrobacter sp. EC-HK427]|nr:conserved exported hypothetical protein [Erythrobacter sp. EC-HK427]
MKNANLLLFVLLATLPLAACQSVTAPDIAATALPPLAADANDAEQVLDALARAEQAAEEGNRAELARQLTRIEALGARFEDEEDVANIARWRTQADLPPPMRGPVGGPAVRRGSIAPGRSAEFGLAFLAGERAAIAIHARSGPAVHISIADGQATTVCTRQTRRGSCVWTPLFTQRHTIRLSNDGTRTAQYHLAIE